MTGSVSQTCCYWGMGVFHIGSKTGLKLRWDYCIKFQLFEWAKHFFSTLTAVCFMLLKHKLYRLPKNYKRHVCGTLCSCKHRFWGYLRLWALDLSEWYRYSSPLTNFLVNKPFYLHRPVLIFQPTANSSERYKQSKQCLDCTRQVGQIAQLLCVVI